MSITTQQQKSYIENTRQIMIEGKMLRINSAISAKEGKYIISLLQDIGATHCVEVGFAMGISPIFAI